MKMNKNEMICTTNLCRVENYYVGDWEDGLWKGEEVSAWSMLLNICCPACGEKGEMNK